MLAENYYVMLIIAYVKSYLLNTLQKQDRKTAVPARVHNCSACQSAQFP